MIRYRYYPKFTRISRFTRQLVIRDLIYPDKRSQQTVESDPQTVIAFNQTGWPVGFALMRNVGKIPDIHVYVAPVWRRQGIGTRMVERLLDRTNLWDKPVGVRPYNAKGRKFYATMFK